MFTQGMSKLLFPSLCNIAVPLDHQNIFYVFLCEAGPFGRVDVFQDRKGTFHITGYNGSVCHVSGDIWILP